MSAEALPNPILAAPRAIQPPGPELSWRWLHVAVGQEMFGRRAGPWGILFAPVPLGALTLGLAAALSPAETLSRGLAGRFEELALVVLLPFLLAALAQSALMAVSDRLWQDGQGKRHLDFSPRVWHYHLGLLVSFLPLLLLQFSDGALDFYLRADLWYQTIFGSAKVPMVGYDPGFSHLLPLLLVPAIHWQIRRVVVKIPCGRLLGLQRELAKLRGAVTWQPEAWSMAVENTFDRWLSDLAPPDAEDRPKLGEHARQHRLRWMGLRKEVVASWPLETPPDLARANRALHVYRGGW